MTYVKEIRTINIKIDSSTSTSMIHKSNININNYFTTKTSGNQWPAMAESFFTD